MRKLDRELRDDAEAALKKFTEGNLSRGLNFERLRGHDRLYSIRINMNYRIILIQTDDAETFEIHDIGPHDIYRRLGGDD